MENYKVEFHEELNRALREKQRDMESEYFELAIGITDSQKFLNIFAKDNNLLRMTMADQILVLRKMNELGAILNELCEKYGFEGGTDDEADS